MRQIMAAIVCALAVLGASDPVGQTPTSPQSRAAWCWKPSAALTDATVRAALFADLAAARVGTLWVQVSTESLPAPVRRPPRFSDHVVAAPRRLTREDEWRIFIADAHRRGLRVEALDGDPTWALKVFHEAPLGIVDAIIDYNGRVAPAERFDGIHFDIEPYLLLAWRFPLSREQLLRELLDLALHCQQHARDAGLRFGVDIPYWWASLDARTGRPIADTLFRGVRKSAAHHLIDHLDNVGIMNYRNSAAGPDGIIENGTPTLRYADGARHARIYMGVETTLSDPSDTWFLAGPPVDVVNERLQMPVFAIGADGRFEGFKVRIWDDGVHAHVGLVAPDGMGDSPAPAFLDALVKLGRRYSAAADTRFRAAADVHRDRGMYTLGRDPEHRNLRARTVRDPRDGVDYLVFVATQIMLPKITFFGLTPDSFARELSAAEAAFSGHASFEGMAIHDVDGMRPLLKRD